MTRPLYRATCGCETLQCRVHAHQFNVDNPLSRLQALPCRTIPLPKLEVKFCSFIGLRMYQHHESYNLQYSLSNMPIALPTGLLLHH